MFLDEIAPARCAQAPLGAQKNDTKLDVIFVTFAENPRSKRYIFNFNTVNQNHADFAFFI